MFVLKKILMPLFAISLINDLPQANWHAQIIDINENTIRIYVAHDIYDKLTYEINSKDIILTDSILEINKKDINSSLYIVVCGEDERLYLELKYNGDKNIIVEENEYYLGYYLLTYNSNCIISNSNSTNKITFYNYNKEISFPNISYFEDTFLPKFSLYYKMIDIFLEAELLIQVPNYIFLNIPYNFIGYSFKYDINVIENRYYFSLSNSYSLDFISNNMYVSNRNIITQIEFPMSFSILDFNMFLLLKYNSLKFIFPFHVQFEHSVFGDFKEMNLVEMNSHVKYEEIIDLS